MSSLYTFSYLKLRRWAQVLGLAATLTVLLSGGLTYRLLLANADVYDGWRIEEAQRLSNVEQIREQLDTIRVKVEATEAKNQALRQRISTQPDESIFLRQLSTMAAKAELEIESFRPGRIISGPSHSELELFVQAHGPYESICKFLSTISQLQRVFRISQASVTRPNAKSETCTFEFQIALYFKPTVSLKSTAL